MLNYSDVKIGSNYKQWQDGRCITLTFCITEDCNLACTYCYMVGKNNKRKMNFDIAKRIVDFVLQDEYLCQEDAVVWDFIGGEPLLEIELIDKLCDYIVAKMYAMKHKWFNKYRFTFSTNGTLYGTPAVQNFIEKHRGHTWFSMSIDGTKEKHNISRIKKDGSGSYDDVIKNVPLWLKQFPNAANKATFAHDDLPYLKESIVHLWDIGIKHVMANVVYEDVWQEGDDIIYENQLKELADHVIENKLWDQYGVAFFNPTIGLPVDGECLSRNRCGAGYKSIAFDCDGNFYPCIRFLDMCFKDRRKIIVGNLKDGINHDYLRAFITLNWKNQSSDECNTCQEGRGCGWCVAYNYEVSKNNTIFERNQAICKMHKANARANKYFWNRFEETTGSTSLLTVIKSNTPNAEYLKYINFITSDNMPPHCGYQVKKKGVNKMPHDILQKGIHFCKDNHLIPIFLGKCNHSLREDKNQFFEILSSSESHPQNNFISVYDNNVVSANEGSNVAILLINKNNIKDIFSFCSELSKCKVRTNLFIQDLSDWNEDNIAEYDTQIILLRELLEKCINENKRYHINLLSDLIYLQSSRDCGAGTTSISLAPNGKFYICPAFYFENENNHIGDLEEGITPIDKKFLLRNLSPICSHCNISNCSRCLYLNKRLTNELHIPPKVQCRINQINKREADKLRDFMLTKGLLMPVNKNEAEKQEDPFDKIYMQKIKEAPICNV